MRRFPDPPRFVDSGEMGDAWMTDRIQRLGFRIERLIHRIPIHRCGQIPFQGQQFVSAVIRNIQNVLFVLILLVHAGFINFPEACLIAGSAHRGKIKDHHTGIEIAILRSKPDPCFLFRRNFYSCSSSMTSI